MIEPIKVQRKTFRADAVQVTAENMEAVAEWCGGVVNSRPVDPYRDALFPDKDWHRQWVEVQISHSAKGRAYEDDWITFRDDNIGFYRVYHDKDYREIFQPIKTDLETQAILIGAVHEVLEELDNPGYYKLPDTMWLAREIVKQINKI